MKQLILSIVLFLPLMAHAEHLFEIGAHGGVAGWTTQPVYVHSQVGFNGGAHVYYDYLSPYVIGFRAGVTCDYHNAGVGMRNYEDHYSTIDKDNQQMEIDYTIGHLSERISMWSVGIPVQLAFSAKNVLFLVGGKAVFPITNRWKQSAENATLSVYYPAFNNRVYEAYALAASRNFAMYNEGQLKLTKVQWWLSAELSYKISLKTKSSRRSYLIVGAYCDYCLTNYTPGRSDAISLIMLTDTRDGLPLQRILTPVMEAKRQGQKLVSRMALFDVGIKVSYAIGSFTASSRTEKYPCRCLGMWR